MATHPVAESKHQTLPELIADRIDEAFPSSPAAAPAPNTPAGSLTAALAQLQSRIPSVRKGQRAKVEKDGRKLYEYDYADLTDVTDAVLPLLGALGLSWVCTPTMSLIEGDRAARLVLSYRLQHTAGDSITGTVPLPDSADPQKIGSAITYWRRYLLCAVTGVAPGGDDDDAAGPHQAANGRSMDEASTLALPPGEMASLTSALDPRAHTPLIEYPAMWELVTRRRAAGKESPIEHDGKMLTWGELFGISLAQRLDAMTSMDELTAFGEEAKVLGKGALPWPWEGITVGTRWSQRCTEVQHAAETTTASLRQGILTAETTDQVEAIVGRMAELPKQGVILPASERDALMKLAAERRVELTSTATANDQPAQSGEPGQPVAPWEWPPDEWTGTARFHYERIWNGADEIEQRGLLDSLYQAGEITPAEHYALLWLLDERPYPEGDLLAWVVWRAKVALSVHALNTMKVATPAGPDSDKILAAIAARRAELTGDIRR